jgi:Chs5-Arf1p-binding protein BUD7/BCH1
LEMFEAALLTLNSCPMFTYNERDLHRMPTPQRTHLPVKQYILDSQILGEDREEDNEVCIFAAVTEAILLIVVCRPTLP